MSTSILSAEPRTELGTRPSDALRQAGRIPASIQGEGGENLEISIDSREFWTARRGHVHLFDIEVGGATEPAIVRELQWDPFGESILHVEFRRVTRGVKIESEVELEFEGHPKGGVLNHLVTHLTVLTLPSEIPDVLVIKVDELEPGHPLTAADVPLPEGVELAMEPETPIAVVTLTRSVDDEEPAEEEGGEPELIGKEPPAEE